jgi:hypothetical protein
MKDQCLKYLDDLIDFVLSENGKQIDKWGIQDHDLCIWDTILHEEVGELSKAILENKFGGVSATAILHEAIQCVTISLKIAEMVYAYDIVGMAERRPEED